MEKKQTVTKAKTTEQAYKNNLTTSLAKIVLKQQLGHPLLRLQQTIGNQAVQGLLQANLKTGRIPDVVMPQDNTLRRQSGLPEIQFQPAAGSFSSQVTRKSELEFNAEGDKTDEKERWQIERDIRETKLKDKVEKAQESYYFDTQDLSWIGNEETSIEEIKGRYATIFNLGVFKDKTIERKNGLVLTLQNKNPNIEETIEFKIDFLEYKLHNKDGKKKDIIIKYSKKAEQVKDEQYKSSVTKKIWEGEKGKVLDELEKSYPGLIGKTDPEKGNWWQQPNYVGIKIKPALESILEESVTNVMIDKVSSDEKTDFKQFLKKKYDEIKFTGIKKLITTDSENIDRTNNKITEVFNETKKELETERDKIELSPKEEDKAIIDKLTREFASLRSKIIQRAATKLVNISAGRLCCVISYFLYHKVTGSDKFPANFGDFYQQELKKGNISSDTGGPKGLYYGSGVGNWRTALSITEHLEYRVENKKKPLRKEDIKKFLSSDAWIAISHQDRNTAKDKLMNEGRPDHFLLIIKDGNGIWRNMDHTPNREVPQGEIKEKERFYWRGGETDFDRVFSLSYNTQGPKKK